MTYLKTGNIREDTKAPGLQQVREKLRVLSMTKAEREAYFRHLDNIMVQNDTIDTAREEGRAEGREEGRAEGREEGKTEGQAAIIRTMLKNGLPIEQISIFTGLSIEEIRKLKG